MTSLFSFDGEIFTNNELLTNATRGFIFVVGVGAIMGAISSFTVYNRAKKKHRKPPGAVPQFLNKLVHTEPFSFIFHGIFWSGVLIIACPIGGTLLFIFSLYRSIKFLIKPKGQTIDAKNNDKELAVYITGCDCGFGRDLAFALARKGFVVFPGCLTDDGIDQYKGHDNINPLKVDVTKNDDSIDAAATVSKWLEDKSQSKKRVLHSIVNNAGIGNIGLIDWLDLSTFRKVMDVNCFGTIRTVKSFLPIFKEQAFQSSHPDARIVNVVSMAGLISTTGACAYSSSKHAAEAFTSCLRLEMQAFNVPVISVNPSWHQTPLSDSTGQLLDSIWNRLTPETREEYGEDKRKKEWNAKVVEDELVSCIEVINPPTQVIIGSDAKYSVMVMRLLPVWLQLRIFDYVAPVDKAAKMK